MKDLLISLSSNYNFNDLKPWVESFNKTGSDAEKIILVYNCDLATVNELESRGFTVMSPAPRTDSGYAYTHPSILPHVERFFHMWLFLRERRDEFRYIVSTDIRDVVFQRDPFEFIDKVLSENPNMNYLAASESVLYRDEIYWGANNFIQSFSEYTFPQVKDRLIYNMGVVAGRAPHVIDLFAQVFFSAALAFGRTVSDQQSYNLLLSLEPFISQTIFLDSEDGWAAQLGTSLDPRFDSVRTEPSPIMIDDTLRTSDGSKEFYIVHQYDRYQDLTDHYRNLY